MIGSVVFEEHVEEVPGSHNPQWSSTVLMVAKEKKKMETRGDIPETRKDKAPPIVSLRSPSMG